jgi:endogenous inhibitor of DNA gyrase (YacG/DUF329 family)
VTAKPVRAARCPICGKPALAEHRPFCSERCKQVDLHRWLSDAYVIPAKEDEPEKPDGYAHPRDERN